MLYDFLLLETYYDSPDTARYFEELAESYDLAALKKALISGDLLQRQIKCGPDCGRHVFWLSAKGRRKVLAAHSTFS